MKSNQRKEPKNMQKEVIVIKKRKGHFTVFVGSTENSPSRLQ